jgi:CubicO group peptidase (beta-lactamase class C family)
MKTKVLFVLIILSMISFTARAQGLDYQHGLGLIGHGSIAGMINSGQYGNPGYGSFQIFSSVYKPSGGIQDFETELQPVRNRMTPGDEISEEQVRLIFNKAKEFPENTQISIAFISNDQLAFYGLKRQNNSIINIDNSSSVFEIGSISKVFTATLLASYVYDGTIDPEEDVNTYLPVRLNNNIRISFKELANHTSGLPRIPSNMLLPSIFNPRNPYKNYSEDKLEKYLNRKAKLTGESVKGFEYSNLGFGLLAYALKEIENKSYNDLLKEKIFSKFGMTNSSAIRSGLKSDLVCGLDKNGFKTPNWDFASLEGAGAILSTTEDLSKFAMAQFDELNKELAITREETYSINEDRAIGLGWFIDKSQSGDILYRHKGSTGGYSSSMVIDINNKTAIIILSNVSAFNKKADNIETLGSELITSMQ